MKEQTNGRQNERQCRFLMLLAGILLILALLLSNISEVYAASWSKMPSGTPIPPNTQVIPLNYKAGSTKIDYNTSSYPGKFKTITYKNGTRGLCVKIANQKSEYRYSNFCTVTYPKATTIRGRYIDVKLEFTYLYIGPKKGNDYLAKNGYMAFARITPSGGTNISDAAGVATHDDGNRYGYGAKKNITTKVAITWSDTKETVKLPFYQGVRDIDAFDDYFTEGWSGSSGFASAFYIWPTCVAKYSGNQMMAQTAKKLNTAGDEEYTKTGLVAPTTGGQWTMTWYAGNCGAGLRIYSQYKDLEAPTKSVDKTEAVKGDTITWTVKQKVGKFYTDMYSIYSNFSFSDTIPEGVQYQSAQVYNGTNNITSDGTLTYNKTTRLLTFKLNNSVLNPDKPQEFYKGQTLSMKITATAENPEEAMQRITNKAASVISGESQDTNPVTTTLRRPDLALAKTAAGKEYKSGEQIPYTVTVKQTTQGLTGKRITVADTLPEGLTLVGEPKLTGAEGRVTVSGNVWTANLSELAYGQTAEIAFTAKAGKVPVEKEVTNTVRATMEDMPGEKEASATVSLLPLPIAIQVEKVWQDEDNFYELRPDTITVELLQDGTPIREKELTAGQGWNTVFEDLPEYRTETEAYRYEIREHTPEGYEAEIARQGTDFRITNTLSSYELVLQKRIAKEDFYAPHGNATFLYRITSKKNPERKWYEELTFNEADTERGEDILTASKTITLPYGEYEVEELDALRYQGEITGTKGSVTVDQEKQTAVVTLHDKEKKAMVTYTNRKNRWDRYSHNDLVINRLRN